LSRYLQENEFSALPPQIGGCTALRTLRLAYNKLTQLPETVSKLSKLNLLMLHDNQLTEVPKVLSQARFLKRIYKLIRMGDEIG
jgi:Leucine-rich repeat (LRR) protein